jgi:hypothetical protein
MRILGLAFAGTATDHRAAMSRFVGETLGLERVQIGGAEADMFVLPDGSHFAVSDPRGMGATTRSIGFWWRRSTRPSPNCERWALKWTSRPEMRASATSTSARLMTNSMSFVEEL